MRKGRSSGRRSRRRSERRSNPLCFISVNSSAYLINVCSCETEWTSKNPFEDSPTPTAEEYTLLAGGPPINETRAAFEKTDYRSVRLYLIHANGTAEFRRTIEEGK
jgi:hypothetical protein